MNYSKLVNTRKLNSWSSAKSGRDGNHLMVVCGWCGTLLHSGEFPVSHGICDACLHRERLKLQMLMKGGNIVHHST